MKRAFWLLGMTLVIASCSTDQKRSMEPVGVGSGGDTVDGFLQATRSALIETLGQVKQEQRLVESLCACPEGKRLDRSCRLMRVLTPEQADYCRGFIRKSFGAILQRSSVDPITLFVLTLKPLLQPDSSDNLRPVIAMTQQGPLGEILFQYDRIRALSPMEMLTVMGHEFGHKVEWEKKGRYIDDNFPLGPFRFDGGGRFFLDTVGTAMARLAVERGIVPQTLGVQDRFSCEVDDVQSFGTSLRLFRGESLKVYETGIGVLPADFSCRRKEADGSYLDFRVLIHEGNQCAPATDKTDRYTRLELWRVSARREKGDAHATQLVSRLFPLRNPLCASAGTEPLNLTYDDGRGRHSFEARYDGTVTSRNAKR
jgi:hypothetical protein